MKTSTIICSALGIMLSLPCFSSRAGAAPSTEHVTQAPAGQLDESSLPVYTTPCHPHDRPEREQ